MAIGDIYRCTIVWTNADTGEDLSSSLHYRQTTTLAPPLATVGDNVKDWWNTNSGLGNAQKINHSDGIELARVAVRRIDPLEPLEQVYTTGLPIAGTVATIGTAPNDAILVSLRTTFIGRSFRGRMYLPPPAVTKLSGPGTLIEASAEDMAGQFQSFIDAMTVDDAEPVVWSPLLSSAETIDHFYVDRRTRSQRRRAAEATLYVTP